MSVDRWNTVLVLGGIRSGKSAFAESLVEDAASVRYVATAVGGEDDADWMNRIEAHQRRRPQSWTTEETGADPGRLAAMLGEAKPDDTLIVDDLGGWIVALLDPANQPQDDVYMVDALAAAVRDCRRRSFSMGCSCNRRGRTTRRCSRVLPRTIRPSGARVCTPF